MNKPCVTTISVSSTLSVVSVKTICSTSLCIVGVFNHMQKVLRFAVIRIITAQNITFRVSLLCIFSVFGETFQLNDTHAFVMSK